MSYNFSNGLHIWENPSRVAVLKVDTGTNVVTITGQLKIVDTTQGLNKILISDADGLASWVDPTTLSASYDLFYVVPVGGTSAGTAITVPNGHTYALKSGDLQSLKVYVNGNLQRIDTNSTANDNDYWETSTTSIDFNYDLPEGAVIKFVIS